MDVISISVRQSLGDSLKYKCSYRYGFRGLVILKIKLFLTLIDWRDDCQCFRKILTPPFLVIGGSVTMKLLGKTHFWVKGVVMWAWPGLYAPQLPQIRLLAVAISFFNKFLKFFYVVNRHAKTDFWLQQLYRLRPFSDPSGLKNPIFLPFFDEPVLILLAVDCQFYAKFRTGRSKTLRRANKKSA